MSALENLFDQFVKERIYLKNVTPKTVYFHRQAWTSFSKHLPDISTTDQLSKIAITDYIVKLRESGIKTVSINTYCRSLNAFFRWLHDEGFVGERLKFPKLATEKLLVKTLPQRNIEALMDFSPKTYVQKRTHMLLLLLLETGLRITEALSLKVSDLNMVHCRIKVYGKGRKERMVKFHPELRRRINRFINLPEHKEAKERRGDGEECFVFCNRDGGPLHYGNVRRDYKELCKAMGIEKVGGFHRFRHTFGSNFIKEGGNVFELSDQLGHADLETTRVYVTIDAEALGRTNAKTSILGNWGKGR